MLVKVLDKVLNVGLVECSVNGYGVGLLGN